MDPALLALCTEALSALTGCPVRPTTGPSQLTPQDFVNIANLRQFYRREGLCTLEYPSLGSLSLRQGDQDEDQEEDLYSAPLALADQPHALPVPGPSPPVVDINPQDFFDPQYNYDFTNVQDGGMRFLRGNEPYFRPCGWRRVALNVSRKYDSGSDVWLSTGAEAWPVSYQGRHMDGALILTRRKVGSQEGGLLDEAAQALLQHSPLGRGIYSSPDVRLAEKHCETFKSKSDGKTYKVLLQNRINPENRRDCEREGVWVVYVPQNYSDLQTRVLVQESVRAYGLLLKQA